MSSQALRAEKAHTAGPWEYENGWLYHRGKSSTGIGYSDTILKIDDAAWRPSDADAARIILAVNCHDELVDALKAAKVVIGMMIRPDGMGDVVSGALDARIAKIDAAISHATGASK